MPPRPPARASGGAATLLPAATTPLSTATPCGGAELKELKLSYKIGDHDYNVRKRAAEKFLAQGNKVKFSILFKGREISHANVGKEIMLRMADSLEAHPAPRRHRAARRRPR